MAMNWTSEGKKKFWCILELEDKNSFFFAFSASHGGSLDDYDLAIKNLFDLKERYPDKDFYLCKAVGKAVKRKDGVILLDDQLK